MQPEQTNKIVIVGGGPVGTTLALALKGKGIPILVLEARSQGASHKDQRALALSYGSRMILERLGLWKSLAVQATAINTIHVSQRGSIGRSRLQASDYGQDALGYVLPYGVLGAALDNALAESTEVGILYDAKVTDIKTTENEAWITYSNADGSTQDLSSALAVIADGGNSLAHLPYLQRKTRDYGHSALVTKVASEVPHKNVAYERFTPDGPVALLPNGHEFSLVWTGKYDHIAALLEMNDVVFLKRLHQHFGDRVGEFLTVGPRLSFPLRLAYLDSVVMPHVAVIGNAAQTMHPVAGQGFNIGLRDAWELAGCIVSLGAADLGGEQMLRSYRQSRKADTQGGLMFTDFLINVFSNDVIGVSGTRGVALGLLDVIKPLKRGLIGKMSFGA